jgi:hypothetical protein
MPTDITGIIYAWVCCSGTVILLLLAIVAVWVWMIFDWNKRGQTDPEIADKYKIQMIIGWPFGYYLNVYRKMGPAGK